MLVAGADVFEELREVGAAAVDEDGQLLVEVAADHVGDLHHGASLETHVHSRRDPMVAWVQSPRRPLGQTLALAVAVLGTLGLTVLHGRSHERPGMGGQAAERT